MVQSNHKCEHKLSIDPFLGNIEQTEKFPETVPNII